MSENSQFLSSIDAIQRDLVAAAEHQDRYDLSTINLIAPASPTLPEYCDDLPLKHNAIAEGLLGNRPYAGVEGFNRIEAIAVKAACSLFGAEHANVQPHSVSQANEAVYAALLEPGDPVLAMRFDAGGHLTHGFSRNYSGRNYDFSFYGLDGDGFIDYDQVAQLAKVTRPKLVICGASSYPRTIEFAKFSDIAKDIGAYLLGDISHPAGLIAADRFEQPFPYCDVATLTLDKTVLGPHGGIILSKEELKNRIDAAVHPGIQSSVPLRRIYGMAQCMIDAHKPKFRDYIGRLLDNMKVFETQFAEIPGLVITGGTDSHMMILDTFNTMGMTGRDAEGLLEEVNILTNRQQIPGDIHRPYVASGLRIGASWITARGYSEAETKDIANAMIDNFSNPFNPALQSETRQNMQAILDLPRANDVWYGRA